MSRAHCVTLVGALAALSAAACEPAADGGMLEPSVAVPLQASVAAANGGSGAMIMRFETVAFTVLFDAERQLLSAHMPSDLAICGLGDGELPVVEVQVVRTPSQIGQRAVTQKGEEHITIYHASSLADAGLGGNLALAGFVNLEGDGSAFCSFLAGPNRIAEGTVQRISTFSLASFHARWTGTIHGVDGRDYHVTEIYQLNADPHDPNNPDTFTEPVVRINLRP